MHAIRYNVAARYTPGSPAQVDCVLAERVAREEKDSIKSCLEGLCGEAEAERARTLGLGLIAFTMQETAKGWDVHDLITKEHLFWPFEARCPRCLSKKVRCIRGKLDEHGRLCDGQGLFVGKRHEQTELVL